MSAPEQRYHPFRTGLLPGEDIRRLSVPRPRIVMRDTALAWAQILAAWTAVALWPEWWVVLPAVVVVGTRAYALLIIAHDGLHRRLFAKARHNDLFNDLCILGSVGAITRLNRTNHMRHHRLAATAEDPDRHIYVHEGKTPRWRFLLFLTGLTSVWRTAANIFLRRPAAPQQVGSAEGYTARDAAIILGWQVALIGGLTWAVGWWGYPVLWVLPVYVFYYVADMVRVFAEHSSPLDDAAADGRMRLVTYACGPVERILFAPHNMNFHAAHHLWPSVPYVNLPEADRLMRRSPCADDRLEVRPSYLGYLWSYARGHLPDRPRPATASG